MQTHFLMSESAQGLRRNVSMHVAVVLTLFVSLTLVGVGALMKMQADKAEDYWGSQLQITVFLCSQVEQSNECPNEATDAQKLRITEVIEDSPEVASHDLQTKQQAYDKISELYSSGGRDLPADVRVSSMPESIWITLKDPQEYAGVTSAVQDLDGVSSIRDSRKTLEPIFALLNVLQVGALGIALFLVLAAILLVANTVRLTAFARRREIENMRLIGASATNIVLPFVIEALVTAVLGVLLAVGFLAGAMLFFGDQLELSVPFVPLIGRSEFFTAAGLVAILGPLLTVLPTLLLTRKYVRV